MIEVLIRLIKRIVVLLPGIGIVYLIVDDVYPIFNNRLPAFSAALLTYVVSAYVLLPAAIRLFRLLHKPRHVPLYSTTPDGFASDPVNIALVGRREDVVEAMTKIGWHLADPRTPRTIFKLVVSIILRRPYPTAPFSTLYLLGKSQDLGFQLPIGGSSHQRHHVRFWAVEPATAERFKEHVDFWNEHHSGDDQTDHKFLWLGAASKDIGLGIIRHNAQFTHMIHHDTNAERDLIVRLLRKAKLIKQVRTIKIGEPYSLRNRVLTGYLESDAHLTIIEL